MITSFEDSIDGSPGPMKDLLGSTKDEQISLDSERRDEKSWKNDDDIAHEIEANIPIFDGECVIQSNPNAKKFMMS